MVCSRHVYCSDVQGLLLHWMMITYWSGQHSHQYVTHSAVITLQKQLSYHHVEINAVMFDNNYNTTGHLFVIDNPVQYFSIMPPFPHGCGSRTSTGTTGQCNAVVFELMYSS